MRASLPLPPPLRVGVLLGVLGAAALLGGCSDTPEADGAGVDETEQAYLQERIEKGIARPPVPKGR